jgi:hypothetical protein
MHSGTRGIPELIRTLITGRGTDMDVNNLVKLAHSFALTRLKQLKVSRQLHVDIFNQPLDLAAFDCIAELFQRDNEGRFIELIESFSQEFAVFKLLDNDIIRRFRSLIFTKLNDGIFRIYHENDPILSNIYRGLKKALRKHPEIKQFDRFGKAYLCICSEYERNDDLPEMPMDKFESIVIENIKDKLSIENYILLFLKIINEQEYYRRYYSIIDLAVILKRILARKKIPLEEVQINIDDVTIQHDIVSIINKSINEVRDILKRKYLESEKLDADLFEKYICAIEEMIYETFVTNDGIYKHYFDFLQKQLPDLSYDEYRNEHRNQFEYFAKLAKNYVKEQLKELL